MYSRCREIECAGVPCLAKRMMGSPLSLSRPWALLILSAKDVSQVILPPQCSSTDNHPRENLIRECCTAAADVCIPGALHSSCRSPNAPHFPALTLLCTLLNIYGHIRMTYLLNGDGSMEPIGHEHNFDGTAASCNNCRPLPLLLKLPSSSSLDVFLYRRVERPSSAYIQGWFRSFLFRKKGEKEAYMIEHTSSVSARHVFFFVSFSPHLVVLLGQRGVGTFG